MIPETLPVSLFFFFITEKYVFNYYYSGFRKESSLNNFLYTTLYNAYTHMSTNDKKE